MHPHSKFTNGALAGRKKEFEFAIHSVVPSDVELTLLLCSNLSTAFLVFLVPDFNHDTNIPQLPHTTTLKPITTYLTIHFLLSLTDTSDPLSTSNTRSILTSGLLALNFGGKGS